MTQKEKINSLRNPITYLYTKEGRSKSYISNLFGIDRKTLVYMIDEWELIKADERHLTPSNEKFLNKNRKIILDGLDSDKTITEISDRISITQHSLVKTFIRNDPELFHHYNLYKSRMKNKTQERYQNLMDQSSRIYMTEEDNLPEEIWKNILGYSKYQVSNMGRIRSYAERYDTYYLLQTYTNQITHRVYVSIIDDNGKRRSLILARIVAHTFVPGYSVINNTVDHLDTDPENNRADNLEWVSQKENNLRAYKNGKLSHKAYSKNKKFKSILMDNHYEFKTIRALARFLGVSETQANRYLSNDAYSDHTFTFVYS